MIQMIASIVLVGSRLVYSTNDIQSMELIHFVIIKSKLMECCFSLPPTATLIDLRKAVALQSGFQYPFRIQSLGETIVPSQLSYQEMIAENRCIKSSWNILSDVWKGTVGFRIPLKVRAPLEQDIAVYLSLSQMCGGTYSNVHQFGWYRFIQQCVQSELCLVQDLCDQFKDQFICHDGELKEIRLRSLNKQKLKGEIDLSFLPSTVTKLDVQRNLLTGIYGLDRLAGKRLVDLKVIKNFMEIDLQPLVRSESSHDNPIRFICVSAHQIARSLLESEAAFGDFGPRVHRAAENWIKSSILDRLTVITGSKQCLHIERGDRLDGNSDCTSFIV